MDNPNILRKGMKRRRANSASDQNQQLLRKSVDIADDTWLEALKFLSCPLWSQKRSVSHQINGIAQRNISRLPKMVVDSAIMYYVDILRNMDREEKFREVTVNHTIVAFDTVMKDEQSNQWFKNRGFTLDAPEDISAENALIGGKQWNREYTNTLNLSIYAPMQEQIPISKKHMNLPWFYWKALSVHDGAYHCKPVLYYAQFNPLLNQYSWDYLAQFLKCIYNPVSYIKKVEMFPVNQKFIDSLKCNIGSYENEPRYICCESFVLESGGSNTVGLSNSLKWLEQNVRAETIDIPRTNSKTAFDLLANFLFDPFGAKQCATDKVNINVTNSVAFLKILIKKFRTIPLVESPMPTIKFWSSMKKDRAHLGPNVIDQEVDSHGADALYMISNEKNRMRISFNGAYCNVSIYSI